MRSPTSSDSFSSRFLGQLLQLSLVKYPLKLLQKASVWIGLVLPVGTLRSKLCPPSQSPSRPGLLARKHRGQLVHLLLSVTPTRIQNFLDSLSTDWGQSNMSQENEEALIDPASKRQGDDVALESQESWFEALERDLPEDDSEDPTYEPSELELDSDEYQSQNDTDLELEEQGGVIVLEPLAVLGSLVPLELGAEDPAVARSGENAPDVTNGDARKPQTDVSEQGTDTACDSSFSQDGEK